MKKLKNKNILNIKFNFIHNDYYQAIRIKYLI